MKIKDFKAVKYFAAKTGKIYSYKSTFGEMQNNQNVFRIAALPKSNVIIFPKKYVS
tara:strand:+ start:2107 stop:2274 length:168 start_codon:yes stop_codon:yes gene_type:complete